MNQLGGKPLGKQVVKATLFFYEREKKEYEYTAGDSDEEWARFQKGLTDVLDVFDGFIERAGNLVIKDAEEVLEGHKMILTDPTLAERVNELIYKEGCTAGKSVALAGIEMAELLGETGDAYMEARKQDVSDAIGYLLDCIGREDAEDKTSEKNLQEDFLAVPSIVAAEELTPADTVRLAGKNLKGIVVANGSLYSHVAILAKGMDIPVLFGVPVSKEWHGREGILHGAEGILYVDPDKETLEKYDIFLSDNAASEMNTEEKPFPVWQEYLFAGSEETGKVRIYANVSCPDEVSAAMEYGAAGIGLYRSECMFLEKTVLPDAVAQENVYRDLLQRAKGAEVVIRVLDAGSDKMCPCIPMEKENNPALGKRGIRFLLEREDIFKEQLRALYRSAEVGKMSLLFPMITNMEEVGRIKELCEEIRKETGVEQGLVPIGMMIETPAAALIAEEIAGACDFISIGSNDLMQYLMAVDRESALADTYVDIKHPAVERILCHIVTAGKRAGCRVGICGELAAEPEIFKKLVSLGIDEISLSVSVLKQKRLT